MADTDPAPRAAGFEDLVKLMERQTELTGRLLVETENVRKGLAGASTLSGNAVSFEILDILRKIYEKQVSVASSSDMTKQAIPAVPATNRWRGTLDTTLVFIALFSAIIINLFVQSLPELSQNPVDRTNELLQNLTNIVVATSDVNSDLNISPPVPFKPDATAVRLNFYWSISSILSAHKKLGDLHRRWLEANRLLAPTVEFLPQLLVLPVVLFVVGLLDNVISSAVPLSSPFIQVLVAGILSSVFDTAVAMYTVWTVLHGWLYPDRSPFQSSLMHFWIIYGPSITSATDQLFMNIPSSCRSWLSWLTRGSDWSQNAILAAAHSSSSSDTAVVNVLPQTDHAPKSATL
ncbi:uncharacterized protein STEHIDRAFT_152705 [Stereum hirsutum FP-91666 SS1]|uniref:uncharacterized protein n=1 Tax=Stereum hirsutum (strain FP-91666) TaxID=721885 RepID=UPI000440EC54|nr:uncharacterized protein STEHIDRAFT_152705 [Stereum hirsutum FP-91666 SS1]EIM91024.1 hypothetical protein STEHIDRAFT_152705 [Stereum hirsutum FP-91666 SS1]